MGNATSMKHHMATAERTGVLVLSKSNLRELPKDLVPIGASIRSMDLSNNRILHIGDHINAFVNLKTLDLSHNRLRYISRQIVHCSKLESINLEENDIDHLPLDFDKLDCLKTINLRNNNIDTFPSPLYDLKNIEYIDLSMNRMNCLPAKVRTCQAIEINFNDNILEQLPEEFAECPRLKILRFDNNKVPLICMSEKLLAESKICLLSFENNRFTEKDLQEQDGYKEYEARYASTKRKMA